MHHSLKPGLSVAYRAEPMLKTFGWDSEIFSDTSGHYAFAQHSVPLDEAMNFTIPWDVKTLHTLVGIGHSIASASSAYKSLLWLHNMFTLHTPQDFHCYLTRDAAIAIPTETLFNTLNNHIPMFFFHPNASLDSAHQRFERLARLEEDMKPALEHYPYYTIAF